MIKKAIGNYIFSIWVILITLFLVTPQVYGAVGIHEVISFQGKVVDANGLNVADGTYDFVVKLYDGAGAGASNSYTESWTSAALWSSTMSSAPSSGGESLTYSTNTNESTIKVGQYLWNTTKAEMVTVEAVNTGTNVITISPTRQAWANGDTVTNKIYVKDGVFMIPINSLNADLSAVDFNTDNIYLGVNFNADGEMKPRIRFKAVPYAMNAKTASTASDVNCTDCLDMAEFEDTLDLDAALTMNQTTNTWTQSYTGTSGAGLTYTASGAVTAGNAAAIDAQVTNASTSVPGMMLSYAGSGFAFRVNDDGTTTDSTPLVVDGVGNVGIGTTTTTAALTVAHTSTTGKGANITYTQSDISGSDTNDLGLQVNYSLSASSASNHTIARTLKTNFTNNLTGGGVINTARIQHIESNTNASTTTSSLDYVHINANNANGTVTAGRGLRVESVQGTSSAGVVVNNLSAGTNNTLALFGTTTIPSGNYGIYNSSTYNNYFAGNVGVNTTGPDRKLDVLDAASPQLRLTQADGSVYGEMQIDSSGNFTMTTTGSSVTFSGDTVNATDFACTDCLDFNEFEDTLDLDAALTVNQTTNTWAQSYTGTSSNGLSYTANSLTTGSAINITATSTPITSSSNSNGVQFNLTQSAGTNATTYNGIDLKFTNSPTVAGNTENAMRIQNQVTTNTTDVAVASLLLLDNADTSGTGSTAITDALKITNSGAIANGIVDAIDASDSTITNALNVGDNIITGTSYSLTASGAITLDATTNITLTDFTNGGSGCSALETNSSGNLVCGTDDTAGGITADSLDYVDFQDTMDLDAALTFNQTTFAITQSFTGTTGPGLSYTASGAVTAGNASAIDVNVSNASTSVPGMMLTYNGSGFPLRINDDGTTSDSTPFIIGADGNVGIGTTTANARLRLTDTSFSATNGYNMLQYSTGTLSGASASYNGMAVLEGYGINNATGAGMADMRGVSIRLDTANDAGDSQSAYGYFSEILTYASDDGTGVRITDDNNSGGGTQTGLYIDLDDTDVTRYGVYVNSDIFNYFAGNVGVGDSGNTNKFKVSAGSAPTADYAVITQSSGSVTDGVDGLSIAMTQADDADASDTNAMINLTATSSSGDADNFYGINIANLTAGSATEYALNIGTGWDRGLSVGSASNFTAAITTSGAITFSGISNDITTGTNEDFTIAPNGTGDIILGSTSNGFTFDPQNGPTYNGTGRPSKTITLSPEYSGAVLTAFYGAGTDSSITGTMTSDTDTSGNLLRNYYQWSSTQGSLNYYTVAVRVSLPKDFSAWATSNAVQVDYATQSTSASNNVVDVRIYNGSDTPGTITGSTTGNVSGVASTWTTATIDDSAIDDGAAPDWDAADETAVIYIRMGSLSSNVVKIGDIRLNYLGKF